MIRKITLENFMSHGRTEIELSDGLTVLTGPNNCGKSALVAALQVLATGGKTTHVMRHGQKNCRVTVETDDGQVVTWERKKSTVKYNINGEDVHRTGQGVPDSLHDVLKLDRVVTKVGASEETHDIHFGQQKSPVFLLDQPGSKAAAFFASSSDASRLIEMQGRHRKQVSDHRSEAKRLGKELAEVAARIEAFSPVTTIGELIESAEGQRTQIEANTKTARRLIDLVTSIQKASAARNRLANQAKVLRQIDRATMTPAKLQRQKDLAEKLRRDLRLTRAARGKRLANSAISISLQDLRPAPAATDTRTIVSLIERMKQTRRDAKKARSICECCSSLVALPAMQSSDRPREILSRLRNVAATVEASKAVCRAVSALVQPPLPRSVDSIDQVIRRMRTATIKRTCMKQTVVLFDPLRVMEPPQDPRTLAQLIGRIEPVAAHLKTAKQALTAANESAAQHKQAIRDFVEANPKCQACGGDIDAETLMSTLPNAHQHAASSLAAKESV